LTAKEVAGRLNVLEVQYQIVISIVVVIESEVMVRSRDVVDVQSAKRLHTLAGKLRVRTVRFGELLCYEEASR
jgi:hypothetical protein